MKATSGRHFSSQQKSLKGRNSNNGSLNQCLRRFMHKAPLCDDAQSVYCASHVSNLCAVFAVLQGSDGGAQAADPVRAEACAGQICPKRLCELQVSNLSLHSSMVSSFNYRPVIYLGGLTCSCRAQYTRQEALSLAVIPYLMHIFSLCPFSFVLLSAEM